MCRWIQTRGEPWPIELGFGGIAGGIGRSFKGNDHPRINYSIVVVKSKLKCWTFGLKNLLLDLSRGSIYGIYLSINLSIYLSINPSIYQSVNFPICQSIHLSIRPCIYLSIYPSIHLSIYLSMYPAIHFSIFPSIHLSICPSILSIFPSIRGRCCVDQPLVFPLKDLRIFREV